jgi:hypothetical protein
LPLKFDSGCKSGGTRSNDDGSTLFHNLGFIIWAS